MDVIERSIDILRKLEGCRLKAYKPIPSDPWTIGYGATGLDIRENMVWTLVQAENDLKNRVTILYNRIKEVLPNLKDHEYVALISFCYNVGIGAFLRSTLFDLLNSNKKPREVIANEFNKWVYSKHVKIPGLVNRRAFERELFLGLV